MHVNVLNTCFCKIQSVNTVLFVCSGIAQLLYRLKSKVLMILQISMNFQILTLSGVSFTMVLSSHLSALVYCVCT